MAGTSVYFVGTVVTNGAPLAGTITVKSTTTATAVGAAVAQNGSFEAKINVAYGDTITLVFDSGQSTTVTSKLAVPPTAGQAFNVYWDTATGVITGLGVQP